MLYLFLMDLVNTTRNQSKEYLSGNHIPTEHNPLIGIARNMSQMIAIWTFMLLCYIYIIFRIRFEWRYTISIAVLCILGCVGHGNGACSWYYNTDNAVDVACPRPRIHFKLNQIIVYGSYTLMLIVIIASSLLMLTDLIAYKQA